MYKDVANLLQITFNAINSDNSNWFSMSRLTDSPWTDLGSESKAVFAIRKWTRRRERRSFHISKTFDACGEDEGWLAVTDPTSCTWEQRKGRGTVVYSNTHHYTNWNSPSKPGKILPRQPLSKMLSEIIHLINRACCYSTCANVIYRISCTQCNAKIKN